MLSEKEEKKMTKEERKKCPYYAHELEDGCDTVFECRFEKCPYVVDKMTESEKKFWGIDKAGESYE